MNEWTKLLMRVSFLLEIDFLFSSSPSINQHQTLIIFSLFYLFIHLLIPCLSIFHLKKFSCSKPAHSLNIRILVAVYSYLEQNSASWQLVAVVIELNCMIHMYVYIYIYVFIIYLYIYIYTNTYCIICIH